MHLMSNFRINAKYLIINLINSLIIELKLKLFIFSIFFY